MKEEHFSTKGGLCLPATLHPLWLTAHVGKIEGVCPCMRVSVSVCVCVSKRFWCVIPEAGLTPSQVFPLSQTTFFSFIYLFLLTTGFLDSVCFHIANHSIPSTWWNLCFRAFKGYFFFFLTHFPVFLLVCGILLVCAMTERGVCDRRVKHDRVEEDINEKGKAGKISRLLLSLNGERLPFQVHSFFIVSIFACPFFYVGESIWLPLKMITSHSHLPSFVFIAIRSGAALRGNLTKTTVNTIRHARASASKITNH